jgi:hypothetical protein
MRKRAPEFTLSDNPKPLGVNPMSDAELMARAQIMSSTGIRRVVRNHIDRGVDPEALKDILVKLVDDVLITGLHNS